MPDSLFNKVAGFRAYNFIKKRLWHRCFAVNFANFLRTTFLTVHLRWLLLSKMWLALTIFHLSRVFFYWRFLVNFISTEKWYKKGKYPDGVQFFYSNNSRSIESVFCIKTVKSWLFKKIFKWKTLRAWFCQSLGGQHISGKKLL